MREEEKIRNMSRREADAHSTERVNKHTTKEESTRLRRLGCSVCQKLRWYLSMLFSAGNV